MPLPACTQNHIRILIRLLLLVLGIHATDRSAEAQTVVVRYDDLWRYQIPSVEPSASWKNVGFNDASWETGRGLLGFETALLPHPGLQRVIGTSGGAQMVYLFRRQFTYEGPTAGATFAIDQIVDDGATYYLNGNLLGSSRHTPSAWDNAASGSVGDATEELNVISGNATSLQTGNNVLAAEVHQISPGGSDLVFGARLKINTPAQDGASWRQQNFGSSANSGNGADVADPDNDLLPNLLEYALALNPNKQDGKWAETFTEGGNLTLVYLRRKAAVLSEVTFTALGATNVAGPWSSEGLIEQILAEDSFCQTVKVSVPLNTGIQFLKLRVRRAVTPEIYGAVGDDGIDDTAAVQSAFNSGSPVIFPNKTYILGSVSAPTGLRVSAPAGATLKCITNESKMLNLTGASNVTIEGLTIDGGGQADGNIYAGVHGVTAIYVSNASNIILRNLSIRKCGIVNELDPIDDNPWGGYGITVESRQGLAENVLIENVTVTDIAGGGMNFGDGIYIAGYNDNPAIRTNNIVVKNCLVQRAGRHCYTVAGGEYASSTPRNVSFINCIGEDAALSGLDIEDGSEVNITQCTFRRAGVYTGYYNPQAIYGSDYRLTAGIATSNAESHDITIQSCLIEDSYYGITYGVGNNLNILNTTVSNSTISDITQGLASGPLYLNVDGCSFQSDKYAMQYYRESVNSHLTVSNTTFAGVLNVSSVIGATFTGCTMNKGIKFVAGGASIQNVTFNQCNIQGTTAHCVTGNLINQQAGNLTFNDCDFHGNGSWDGINIPYNGGQNWTVTNCTFDMLSNGIKCENANEQAVFATISNNTFTNVTNGIDVIQAIKDGTISDNTFSGVTGWCISFTNIFTPTKMQNYAVTRNTALSGVANGIRLQVINGTYEFVRILDNNFSTSTATNCLFDAPTNNSNCIKNNAGASDLTTSGCN